MAGNVAKKFALGCLETLTNKRNKSNHQKKDLICLKPGTSSICNRGGRKDFFQRWALRDFQFFFLRGVCPLPAPMYKMQAQDCVAYI